MPIASPSIKAEQVVKTIAAFSDHFPGFLSGWGLIDSTAQV